VTGRDPSGRPLRDTRIFGFAIAASMLTPSIITLTTTFTATVEA
jgi:hypothetical protein